MHERSVAELARLLAGGELSSRDLVAWYVERFERIDRAGNLHSIIEINPDAEEIAAALDAERARGVSRGPLHGVPILLKDNVDTADRMETTAGSLALLGSRPAQDATVAARLREAGALLLGKASLSEWANFRSTHSTSGWSARGGQCRNPYDPALTPCGSSSGSGAAVSADIAPVALGTETDGSILCPAAMCGIVGLKPTVGLTSRAGVIPISHTQDTVGPMARTVEDAALILGVIAGPDPRDEATAASAGRSHADYTQFLVRDGLRGARIGVPREYHFGTVPEADAAVERAIDEMRRLGAVIVDPANIPTWEQQQESSAEMELLRYEFKADLNAYLQTRPDAQVSSLSDIIRFNEEHADEELRFFGQEIFLEAEEKGPLTETAYLEARETSRRLAGEEGIDAVMRAYQLDALVMPTAGLPWPINYETGDEPSGHGSAGPAARAGYPAITVPVGFAGALPLGITFMGTAFSESTLLRLAYCFEQATKHRRPPPIAGLTAR